MNITQAELARLKKAYNKAVADGRDKFAFDGRIVLVAYAKYLIEYLTTTNLPSAKKRQRRRSAKIAIPDASFAERLTRSLLQVFSDAYKLHATGTTETELLIQHDIFAAASDHHDTIKEGHRKALLAAVAAVDDGIPYQRARDHLELQLRRKMKEILDGNSDS